VFIGLVPLWLALLALLWGNRDARGYALLGFGALWLAFGQFPVGPLYRFLPGFSAGAGTCRLAAVWCFGAAVAAGLTAERLQSSPLGWRQLLGGLALLLAGWVVAAQLTQASVRELGLLPVAEAASFGAKLAGLQGWAFLAAGLAVALRATRWLPVLVAAELLWFGWGYNPSSDPAIFRTPATLQELAARPPRVLVADRPQGWGFYRRPEGFALPPNLATVAGIRDVGGYDSLLPALHKDVFFQAAGRSPTPLINGNMLLLGGVRWRDAPPPVSQAMSASGTVEHKSVGRARRLTAAGRFADPGEVSDPSANRTLVTIDGDGALLLYDSPYLAGRCTSGSRASRRRGVSGRPRRLPAATASRGSCLCPRRPAGKSDSCSIRRPSDSGSSAVCWGWDAGSRRCSAGRPGVVSCPRNRVSDDEFSGRHAA